MKRLPRELSISIGAEPQGPDGPPPIPIQPRGDGSIIAPIQQAILWPAPLRPPARVQLSAVARDHPLFGRERFDYDDLRSSYVILLDCGQSAPF